MSRDWTQGELQTVSKAMKEAGHLGYDEFCERLDKTISTAYCKDEDNNLIKISGPYNHKEKLEKQLREHFSHLRYNSPVCKQSKQYFHLNLESALILNPKDMLLVQQ